MPKFTHPHEFEKVKTALEAQGLQFAEASVSWIPQNTIKVEAKMPKSCSK